MQDLFGEVKRTRADGWQPIETIPRDGTKVLGTDGNDWAAIAFDWYDADEDKVWYSLYHGDYVSSQPEFTHWMPLPEPPNPCQGCGKTVSYEVNPCEECKNGK